MKILGLCFALPLAISIASAQESPTIPSSGLYKSPTFDPDRDAVRKWLQKPRQSSWPRMGSVRSQRWTANDVEAACGAMRTYRVEREAPDSDSTRSSGYITCVPMARFKLQDALIPNAELEEAEAAPSQ